MSDRLDDRDPVDAWVRRHQTHVWRYLRLRGCPTDVADDLVQDALMAAVHKHIHTEPEPRASAWLRRAADNLWRMHCRSEGRRRRHVSAAHAQHELVEKALEHRAGSEDAEAWRTALRACLASLDGRPRRLLDLHYAHGASREVIANEFGMRANGVKAFLRRVRDGLRECILRRIERDREGV